MDDREREHQYIPDDAVTESARGHEEQPDSRVLDAPVEATAEAIFRRVESIQQ
jgi:hypothetical protein